MTSKKSLCTTCNAAKRTFSCDGCSQKFCLRHLNEHQEMLNDQLGDLINDHVQFKEGLVEQQQDPRNSALVDQIDRWERTSVETIRRTAEECRERIIGYSKTAVGDIGQKLEQFIAQLEQIREENEFNEIDLQHLTNKLAEMKLELAHPASISLREDSQALIHKIHVADSSTSEQERVPAPIQRIVHETPLAPRLLEWQDRKWKSHASTTAGRHGHQLNQLDSPQGIFVDRNKSIFITDCSNHRVLRWDGQAKSGTVVAGGHGQGRRTNQLNQPTDVLVIRRNESLIIADRGNRRVVRWSGQNADRSEILLDNIDCFGLAMDRDEFLYVVNELKHEVRRWKEGESEGILVAGGNGAGDQLNQLNDPRFVFVDEEQSVYVSESENHRVIKWRKGATEGEIVAGGNGAGHSRKQLSHPQGVLVDRRGEIYVADWDNHRVMRWREGESEGEIVAGGNGQGHGTNQLHRPTGLSFDEEGNLYVADCWNHRIEKFHLVVT